MDVLQHMTSYDAPVAHAGNGKPQDQASLPVVIATILRPDDFGGVHTHVRQIRAYLETRSTSSTLVTPFSWSRLLTYPAFGPRLVLERLSGSASVAWYRYWHELFLREALRRCLAGMGDCVVYAQGPLEAQAALRVRQGPNQRVVMAVHYKVSQADEWVNRVRGAIKRDGTVFRAVRRAERQVIPAVDGIVFVSEWARQGILTWLPEAAAVPCAVIGNFVAPLRQEPGQQLLGDLISTGGLDLAKNHRFLLNVLAEAKQAGRSFTLDLFGDGPLRHDLEQQASSLGLAGQVRFHGFRRDVRDFLPNYRAYVHASYAETSSFAIIEAMAAGLPIVAASVGGIPELYNDGVEGRFWSLDDPAEAAAMLIELLDSEPARAAAGKAAYDRFRREFDVNVAAPRLLAFLYGQTPSDSGQRAEANKLPLPFALDSRLR
jgi:glycosyltransferase involved in cell wall biosynthesis